VLVEHLELFLLDIESSAYPIDGLNLDGSILCLKKAREHLNNEVDSMFRDQLLYCIYERQRIINVNLDLLRGVIDKHTGLSSNPMESEGTQLFWHN
jgi:hypothetical protein